MKKIFLLFLITIPLRSISQVSSSRYTDTYKEEIDKTIFRLMMTLSLDETLTIAGCYEHEIYKPLTVVVKAGPVISRDYLLRDAYGNEQYNWYIKAAAAAEVRCYYNLKRRIRHEKTIRNFSGYYVSLEPFVVSSSLVLINNDHAGTIPAKAGVYLNIGFHKQTRHTYFNAFFGTRFFGSIYENSNSFLDVIHAGVTIGRAF